jgi:hypothetical protein
MPAGAETRSRLVQHQQHARLHVQEILGNIVVVVHPECFGTLTVFMQDFKIILFGLNRNRIFYFLCL